MSNSPDCNVAYVRRDEEKIEKPKDLDTSFYLDKRTVTCQTINSRVTFLDDVSFKKGMEFEQLKIKNLECPSISVGLLKVGECISFEGHSYIYANSNNNFFGFDEIRNSWITGDTKGITCVGDFMSSGKNPMTGNLDLGGNNIVTSGNMRISCDGGVGVCSFDFYKIDVKNELSANIIESNMILTDSISTCSKEYKSYITYDDRGLMLSTDNNYIELDEESRTIRITANNFSIGDSIRSFDGELIITGNFEKLNIVVSESTSLTGNEQIIIVDGSESSFTVNLDSVGNENTDLTLSRSDCSANIILLKMNGSFVKLKSDETLFLIRVNSKWIIVNEYVRNKAKIPYFETLKFRQSSAPVISTDIFTKVYLNKIKMSVEHNFIDKFKEDFIKLNFLNIWNNNRNLTNKFVNVTNKKNILDSIKDIFYENILCSEFEICFEEGETVISINNPLRININPMYNITITLIGQTDDTRAT